MPKLTIRYFIDGKQVDQVEAEEPAEDGEIFLLGVQGERRMMRVRMERQEGRWYAVFSGARGEHRVELRGGLRAAFFDQRERYAEALGRN